VGAHQRLVVRRAHHDAHLVGQRAVFRIVVVERIAPHRRPQVVAAHAQDQLEQLAVEPVVESAELLLGPAGQRRRLVVQEDAAVTHDRRFGYARAGRHRQHVVARRRHVGPPVPGRDADLLRDRVQPVDRAAFVAAGHDERAGDARQRIAHGLHEISFPLATHCLGVDLPRARQPVDERTLAERADDDHVGPARHACRGVDQDRLHARDARDVALQVGHRAAHALEFSGIDDDARGLAGARQHDGVLARIESNEGTFPQRPCRLGTGQDGGGEPAQ
jgi:hypothetical protein